MTDTVSQELIDAGRGYESLFVPALFIQWTPHMLAGAGVRAGLQVLDIACGTGVLTREALSAAGPDGRVVGVDPAPGMLAAAREVEPDIEWILGSAEALDLDDASFDCVLSQFGMMFFDDRRQAAAEMWRVLKPGGRVAIAVWSSVEHNPIYADIIALVREKVGDAAADVIQLPFTLPGSEVGEVLAASGFNDIQIDTRSEDAHFPGTRQIVEAELRGWLPLFDIVLEDEKIEEVLVASDALLSQYAQPSGDAIFPTSAHIVTATRA
jgi:SAM-dependent methyltransferase